MPHGLWKSAQQYTTARHFRQLKCSFARTTRIDLERVREKECTPQFALQKALAAIVGKVWRLTARCRHPALTCCTGPTWCRGRCTTGGSCRGGQSLSLFLS